ncbi:insecticidal delta-endotoxin Cry8Ea1 family protein [Bacillus cereus]
MTKKGLGSLTKTANGGNINYNNFFRDLTISSMDLIPYGGALFSTFIALMWPMEQNSNIMDQLVEKFSKMVDEKIVDYDNGTLKQQAIALQDQLEQFDKLVNRIENKVTTYMSDREAAATLALNLNTAFNNLLRNCQKDDQKVSELPLYTQIATTHLVFLKYVVENGGKGTTLDFEKNALQTFKDSLDNGTKEYSNHIQNVAREGLAKISNQKLGFVATNNEEYTQAMMLGAQRTIQSLEQLPIRTPEQTRQLNNARSELEAMKNGKKYVLPTEVAKDIYDYRASTVDNLAFNTLISILKGNKHTGWVKENGLFFYEKEGIRENSGWFRDEDKRYYYLDPKDGHMVTGWIKDKEKWYYLIPNKYYNGAFKEGEMVYQISKILIDGKEYEFDGKGVCLNP